jgi:hypothetical protein
MNEDEFAVFQQVIKAIEDFNQSQYIRRAVNQTVRRDLSRIK